MSKEKQGKPETVADLIRGNAIGNTYLRKNKIQAERVLEGVRLSDGEKLSKGYRWMCKEKTSRLVHPDNLNRYEVDGWKFDTSIK